MKPTKNRVYCVDAGKVKMLFSEQKQADNFIKFNAEEIKEESGYSPERSYYCTFCGGWHVTSKKGYTGISRKEQFFEDSKAKNNSKSQEEIKRDFEAQMEGFSDTQKGVFVENIIETHVREVDSLLQGTKNESRLKELRQELNVLYKLRKPYKELAYAEKERLKYAQQKIDDWAEWAKAKGYDI